MPSPAASPVLPVPAHLAPGSLPLPSPADVGHLPPSPAASPALPVPAHIALGSPPPYSPADVAHLPPSPAFPAPARAHLAKFSLARVVSCYRILTVVAAFAFVVSKSELGFLASPQVGIIVETASGLVSIVLMIAGWFESEPGYPRWFFQTDWNQWWDTISSFTKGIVMPLMKMIGTERASFLSSLVVASAFVSVCFAVFVGPLDIDSDLSLRNTMIHFGFPLGVIFCTLFFEVIKRKRNLTSNRSLAWLQAVCLFYLFFTFLYGVPFTTIGVPASGKTPDLQTGEQEIYESVKHAIMGFEEIILTIEDNSMLRENLGQLKSLHERAQSVTDFKYLFAQMRKLKETIFANRDYRICR